MRKQQQLTTICFLALVMGLWDHPLTAQVVEIPDLELQKAIRAALDKPTGDITVRDMESLTELDDARGYHAPLIRDLKGLEAAKNLRSLSLGGRDNREGDGWPSMDIDDFSPLAGLTVLSTIDFSENRLTSLILPEGLTSLTWLDLSNNQLTTLTLPDDLTSLTELEIQQNQLTNLTLPQGLTSLTRLNISDNQLTSLTLPDDLMSLTELDLSGNQLTGLTLPDGLTNLTWLLIANNPLEEMAIPVWMDLGRLNIGGFPKEQVTFHAGWVKMQYGQLIWSHGVLEYAPDLNGEWLTLPASSPFQLSPIGQKGFFRVRVDQ